MDYRNTKTYKSSTEAQRDKIAAAMGPLPWWRRDDEKERCDGMISMARALKDQGSERQQANLRHARLYENVEVDHLGTNDFASAIVTQALRGRGLVRMNVVAACEDTLAAKVAKNKPRPNFVTSGGSWDMQRKARQADKFCRGLFYEMGVYEKSKDVFQDGATFGTGLAFVFKGESDKLEFERVMPDEVYVDDNDGFYAAPRTVFRRKAVQRDVLVSKFPAKADDLLLKKGDDAGGTGKDSLTPTAEVWEAWHLPSKKGAGDGKHCIAVDGVELLCEEWKIDQFPFIPFRYKKRTVGFWGKGVAETLTGIQLELNRLILSVSEQLRRKGRGRIFVQHGSKVLAEHLDNGIADIVKYVGQPPIVDNSNAVAPEEFMQIERLYRMAFQEVGLSELSVAAKKPSGLDAAVALREYSDIESERFALVHQAWEVFFLDLAKLCLRLIRWQYGNHGYLVRLPSRRYLVEVDWKNIALDDDAYIMQVFPSSSLPQYPAARYAKVMEMRADGMIDTPTAQRLLDFPDLEQEQNLANAAIDDVDETISAILDEDEPVLRPVEPYQNLSLLITRAKAAYLFARHHGADEKRLDMLRQLVDQATAMVAAAAAPPPAMPGAPAGPPMPVPAPGMANVGNVNINAAPPVAPTVPPVVA